METSRRQFCKGVAAVGTMAAACKLIPAAFAATTMEEPMQPARKEDAMTGITLPPLPYAEKRARAAYLGQDALFSITASITGPMSIT